jgi:hypothetical protein
LDGCIVDLTRFYLYLFQSILFSFHFYQLAQDNDSARNDILSTETLPSSDFPNLPETTTYAQLIIGRQSVSKFRESSSTSNMVNIYLLVIRLKNVDTDVLITYNHPVRINPASSSAATGAREGSVELAVENFRELVKSFVVRDWGLFN